MATDFDFDLLNEAIEEAPTAGYGPQVNFGKVTMQVDVVWWDDNEKKFKSKKFTNQKVDKSKGEKLQITFESDLSEFNPALTNPWKRRVDVKKSSTKADGTKDPKALTDWSEIVEPSLKELLGKDWAKKFGKGVYAEFEDAETVELNKKGDKKGWDKPVTLENGEETTKHYTNTAPRFKRIFKSKADCLAARSERFSKNGTSDESEESGDIPAEVVSTARGLIQALGVEQAKGILSSTPPYNAYDTEALVTAANPL